MKQEIMSLTNHFLIATPAIEGELFENSLVLICEHNKDGAFGLIVNKPTEHSIGEVFVDLNLPTEHPSNKHALYTGGPLSLERGFVLHSSGTRWDGTIALSETLYLSTTADILDDLAKGQGPSKYLVALGYSSWDAGQLEKELFESAWQTVPASRTILFNTPDEEKHATAIRQLGFNISLATTDGSVQ